MTEYTRSIFIDFIIYFLITLSGLSRKFSLSLTPGDMAANIDYNFTLFVTNYWNQQSTITHHVASRSSKYMPRVRIMGGMHQRIKASQLNKV